MENKKKVYIAGALNSTSAIGYLQNVSTMLEWSDAVLRQGFAVFVPALDLLMCIKYGDYTYDMVFQNSQAFLAVCDAVFVCPQSDNSKGTQREIVYAKMLCIPVFESISDLTYYFDNQ